MGLYGEVLGWGETLDSALASYHVTLGKYYHQPQFVQVESKAGANHF